MAHWGIAMSSYHQIWDRPDADTLAKGWAQMQKASALHAATARERAYIAAASRFFRPDDESYQSRVDAYSAAMGEIHRRFPDDIDAGAFYALSLLAAEAPDDTSLVAEHKALDVLNPLFAKYPDHPGLVHYIIHACDTPSLASEGLAAASHYGEIAASGAHAVHMPGHIFARLGLWQEDIRRQPCLGGGVQAAEKRHESDGMDQFHSDDFLIYAYLQSGQEARAEHIVEETAVLMTHYESMPEMTSEFMRSLFPYYRNKFPAFYALETRDWKSAAKLEPAPTKEPETQFVTYWARVVAHGHLHEAEQARADLAAYESLLDAGEARQTCLHGGRRRHEDSAQRDERLGGVRRGPGIGRAAVDARGRGLAGQGRAGRGRHSGARDARRYAARVASSGSGARRV